MRNKYIPTRDEKFFRQEFSEKDEAGRMTLGYWISSKFRYYPECEELGVLKVSAVKDLGFDRFYVFVDRYRPLNRIINARIDSLSAGSIDSGDLDEVDRRLLEIVASEGKEFIEEFQTRLEILDRDKTHSGIS